MSSDMSMFKKMKERITDEVNSATNKLQNMQIIDQLTSSIGQVKSGELAPNQLLPDVASMPRNNQFSLIDDGPIGGYNEEEELNSELSPQFQLFNEHTIKRIGNSNNSGISGAFSNNRTIKMSTHNKGNTDLDNNLSSDLEDDLEHSDMKDDGLEVEIDLLAEQPQSSSNAAALKESLKLKNSQIKALKELLSERDQFKESNEELKRELNELKESHENWTVSIAESKRDMHQEIENKNAEMEKLTSEISDLQSRLNDKDVKIRQLKSAIQDLESRLVSTSAAHQKERESLTKELTVAKNAAIKQLNKEHEHNIERVKLDLEKSIEVLKFELLNKDEQLVKDAEQKRQLQIENHNIALDLEQSKRELQKHLKESDDFKQQFHELNSKLDLMTTANEDQETEIQSLKTERNTLNEAYRGLKSEFEELSMKNESLSRVIQDNEMDMQTQQDQLDNLTLIEQELDCLKKENCSFSESLSQLKAELCDRNSDLSQLKRQTEEQDNQVTKLNSELQNTHKVRDELRREKDSLASENEFINKQNRDLIKQLVVRILTAMKNLETPNISPGSDKSCEATKTEDSLISESKRLPNPIDLMDELSSLAVERSTAYLTETQRLQAVSLENSIMGEELVRLKEELDNLNREKTLETQCSVEEAEKLRTENQALIHDQQAYDEKVHELEEEIADLTGKISKIKVLESKCISQEEKILKLEEALTEKDAIKSNHNSTLLERISILEDELRSRNPSDSTGDHTYQIRALQRVLQQYQEENQRLKEHQKTLTAQMNRGMDTSNVPDSTEFEYLKNIVHQFMLGKEPLVLARVISAVFKFDKNQIEQICKIQETVQAALKQNS